MDSKDNNASINNSWISLDKTTNIAFALINGELVSCHPCIDTGIDKERERLQDWVADNDRVAKIGNHIYNLSHFVDEDKPLNDGRADLRARIAEACQCECCVARRQKSHD